MQATCSKNSDETQTHSVMNYYAALYAIVYAICVMHLMQQPAYALHASTTKVTCMLLPASVLHIFFVPLQDLMIA